MEYRKILKASQRCMHIVGFLHLHNFTEGLQSYRTTTGIVSTTEFPKHVGKFATGPCNLNTQQ